jgi:hypothetical protein
MLPTGTGMATASTRPPADTAVVGLARPAVLRLAPMVAVLACASCSGADASRPTSGSELQGLTAEVDQLRSDVPLNRVEIGVVNSGEETVIVDSLRVRIPGFRSGERLQKDSPVRPGLTVNLPWPHGKVQCTRDSAAPDVGRPIVTLTVHTDRDPTSRTLRLTATDRTKVLQRIADRTCEVERVGREVSLAFGDSWRPEKKPDGVLVLHGTLQARLLIDEPREVTEMRGAIMYAIEPDASAGPVPTPLAALSTERRDVSIPVLAYAGRCTGHVIGEIKQPYAFLVWVGRPGEEPVAVTPAIGRPTKDALRLVCAF